MHLESCIISPKEFHPKFLNRAGKNMRQAKTGRKRNKHFARTMIAFALIYIAVTLSACGFSTGGDQIAPTPSETPIPIEQVIEMTFQAAAAQTAVFYTATPPPTLTLAPSITPQSTATSFLIGTFTPIPTDIQPFNPFASTSTWNSETDDCNPGDQLPYIYQPERLKVVKTCLYVTGVVIQVNEEPDGGVYILLRVDPRYAKYLNENNEKGALVVQSICTNKPKRGPTVEVCSRDPNPLTTLPKEGQHVWIEGQYVLDKENESRAEIHPLARWGMLK
jgi:hypothetical protein